MDRTKAMLAAVIGMGVLIVALTAILIATVIRRVVHPAAPVIAPAVAPVGAPASLVPLDQPPGTRIMAAIRQSDTTLALLLSGGGVPDRVLLWDEHGGRITAQAGLQR